MKVSEFLARAKKLNQRHMMEDFFRYLKKEKRQELLKMQNEQLFRLPPEGKDGIMLGTYKKNNQQTRTKLIRPAGSPFWMENTGQLKDKMRVKVLVGPQEILFENKRKDVDKPWFRYNEDVYATSEWFGLNEENMKIVKGWAKRFMEVWTYNMIYDGKRTTTGEIL